MPQSIKPRRTRARTVANQDASSGSSPIAVGSVYTMPQRETVAGDATARSITSNIMCTCSGILMRSPFTRQSILESSSTVFMDSIQSASTGPSK